MQCLWLPVHLFIFIIILCFMSFEGTSDFELITLISSEDVADVLGSFKYPHHHTHFPSSHWANKLSNKQSGIASYITSERAWQWLSCSTSQEITYLLMYSWTKWVSSKLREAPFNFISALKRFGSPFNTSNISFFPKGFCPSTVVKSVQPSSSHCADVPLDLMISGLKQGVFQNLDLVLMKPFLSWFDDVLLDAVTVKGETPPHHKILSRGSRFLCQKWLVSRVIHYSLPPLLPKHSSQTDAAKQTWLEPFWTFCFILLIRLAFQTSVFHRLVWDLAVANRNTLRYS